MPQLILEYCCKCDCPTGRAGVADDSLFIEDDGPFCRECFDEYIETAARERPGEAARKGIDASD